MSIIKVTTRGNEVKWSATFKDFNGNISSPLSATVYLNYPNGSSTENASVSMSEDSSGDFTAIWDTSVASPGMCYWSVRAEQPSIAADGQFEISGNAANLET
jgi:hypothetical protein